MLQVLLVRHDAATQCLIELLIPRLWCVILIGDLKHLSLLITSALHIARVETDLITWEKWAKWNFLPSRLGGLLVCLLNQVWLNEMILLLIFFIVDLFDFILHLNLMLSQNRRYSHDGLNAFRCYSLIYFFRSRLFLLGILCFLATCFDVFSLDSDHLLFASFSHLASQSTRLLSLGASPLDRRLSPLRLWPYRATRRWRTRWATTIWAVSQRLLSLFGLLWDLILYLRCQSSLLCRHSVLLRYVGAFCCH